MGLFDTISRVGTAIITGGTSELVRLASPSLAKSISGALVPTNLGQVLNVAGALALKNPGTLIAPTTKGLPTITNPGGHVVPLTFNSSGAVVPYTPPQPVGVKPMGLDLGGILGTVAGIFGGNQNPVFSGISNVASLAQSFVPAPTTVAVRPPTPTTSVPMVAARAMVGRGFFAKYPNLATSIQQLRNRGFSVKRSQLWNLLKRFGPELLVTGGLLTAAAVNELMLAGPGRRTMNPANAKALRRAARRIKSFHKLCGTVDLLKSRGRRTSTRCGTCRKSPCRC